MMNRTLITGILAVALLVGSDVLRPAFLATGLPEHKFFANKLLQKPAYDIVLVGDSRVLRDLSPEAIKEPLGNYRIFNYGFAGLGYDSSYLESAEHLLAPSSRAKMIVMGITPHSLTPKPGMDNGYVSYRKRHILELYSYLFLGDFLRLFEPYPIGHVWNAMHGNRKGYYERYESNGWVASRLVPEFPELSLKPYEKLFLKNRVSGKIVAQLLATVRELLQRNILVVAFRPPTTTAIHDLENRLSGFDEGQFVKEFSDAGGIWLTFPLEKYTSYDGSHLREDSAVALSQDLALEIRKLKNSSSLVRFYNQMKHETVGPSFAWRAYHEKFWGIARKVGLGLK